MTLPTSEHPDAEGARGTKAANAGAPSSLPTREALWLYLGVLFLLITLGAVLRELRPGPSGIALTELLAILLPVLVLTGARRLLALRILRLWPFSFSLLFGGALVGAAWFYGTAIFIEPLAERLVPVPPALKEEMMQLLLPAAGLRPAWVDLFCFALMPAVCEEVLFRGVMLPSLRAGFSVVLHRRLSPRRVAWLALLVTAMLFGVFHLTPAKMLPTAILGFGFGAVVLWTGSLWPAIAMHFGNNALVILLLRAGLEEPPSPLTGAGGGWAWLLGACICAGIGLWLMRWRVSALTESRKNVTAETDSCS